MNTCTKCGGETRNKVVCDDCNKAAGPIKYYRYLNENRGERYFKVSDGKSDVLQIVFKTGLRGRLHQRGITHMKYISFIGSYGWKRDDPDWNKSLSEITKEEFVTAFDKMVKEFKTKL